MIDVAFGRSTVAGPERFAWTLLPPENSRGGGGSYLASQAEEQLYASEIAAEGREIDEFPKRETEELAIVLEREGLSREQAETVAHGLASNSNVFLRTKVEKELGLSPDAGGAALGRDTTAPRPSSLTRGVRNIGFVWILRG